MSLKKTYIDSGVLITAFQGVQSVSIRANQILNDENREFASSRFVQLDVLPKATFNKQKDEAEFYETFFSMVQLLAITDYIDSLIEKARSPMAVRTA